MFSLNKFLNICPNYYHIKFNVNTTEKYITMDGKKYETISNDEMKKINEKTIVLVQCYYRTRIINNKNLKYITLQYFIPSIISNYNPQNWLYKNTISLINFTKKNNFYTGIPIGSIQVDNLLYKKNLPKYDIVYFPNYPTKSHSDIELSNLKLLKETSIINKILKKYQNKYSIVTLPHPGIFICNRGRNSNEYINPKFNFNNEEYIKNAKVIINSCKSFISLSMCLNKTIIHIKDSLLPNLLPNMDEYVKKGNYYIPNLTEENFELCLKCALAGIKEEEKNYYYNKHIKEFYDVNEKSPTEKLIDIINYEYENFDN